MYKNLLINLSCTKKSYIRLNKFSVLENNENVKIENKNILILEIRMSFKILNLTGETFMHEARIVKVMAMKRRENRYAVPSAAPNDKTTFGGTTYQLPSTFFSFFFSLQPIGAFLFNSGVALFRISPILTLLNSLIIFGQI